MTHRKPSVPPFYIEFPKQGAPKPVVEQLPTNKDKLELALARKFVHALQKRFGRVLTPPNPSNPEDRWPDAWTSEAEQRIAIEVVEVVNLDHIAGEGYGVPQPVSLDVAKELLRNTIQRKIDKRYGRPSYSHLWLLAYDVTHAVAGDWIEAVQVAHDSLVTTTHPFTEVWFMSPMPYADVPSFLESVWPTMQYSSTDRR